MESAEKRDKRYALVDRDKITMARHAKGWSREELSDHAGLTDIGPVKRAENDGQVLPRMLKKIANALDRGPEYFLTPIGPEGSTSLPARERYTWDDFKTGAEKIAKDAFYDFGAETVLTFPSTSLVFVGLVLAMLPPGDSIRTKVYTTILLAGSALRPPDGFLPAPAGRFTILVPKAVVRDRAKKIVVIDDYITSGGAMEALRRFFQKKYGLDNVRFACCICYDGLRARPDRDAKLPDFVGIEPYAQHMFFELPWEKEPITFEDAFKRAPTLQQYAEKATTQAKNLMR
jgi:transcriptional regulator with XRE-family HTH domain